MGSRRLRAAIGPALLVAGTLSPRETRGNAWDPAAFAIRVRPILARCAACHGGDEPAGDLEDSVPATPRIGDVTRGLSGRFYGETASNIVASFDGKPVS